MIGGGGPLVVIWIPGINSFTRISKFTRISQIHPLPILLSLDLNLMEETFSLCSPSTLIRICQFYLYTWSHRPNSDSNSSVSWRQLLLLENVGCDQLPMLFSPPFPSVDLRPILVAFALNFQCCISPNFPSVNDILWWLKPSGLCNLQRFPFTIFEVPRIIHFRTS